MTQQIVLGVTAVRARSVAAAVDIIQDGPSLAVRLICLMIRPASSLGSYLLPAPWPWGVVEFAARAVNPSRERCVPASVAPIGTDGW